MDLIHSLAPFILFVCVISLTLSAVLIVKLSQITRYNTQMIEKILAHYTETLQSIVTKLEENNDAKR